MSWQGSIQATPGLTSIPSRNWYRCRWEVEIFFDVLRYGCKIEALQLSSIERLQLALAPFMFIAWRVQMLMRPRTCLEMDCEVRFERDAWQPA
nr:hypothetical protein [uncultured Noviherbaspirillum sp.]